VTEPTRRLAVVTGGGKGIGRAVVMALAASGHRVVAVGRDEAALADVAGQAAPAGAVDWRRCDVGDEDEVRRCFDGVDAVDVLVNNAGIARSSRLDRVTLADWEDHLRVNATGAFLCTRAVLDGMRQRDWGRIVTVASTAALGGGAYIGAYSASKHAALGLMRSVAAEVAGSGVTANCVCPTYVRTEMTERTVANIVASTGRTEDEAQAAIEASSPLGRLLEPEEVASAVVWLVGDDAAAVNGQAIVLDGGGRQQ
jgi:NAD(P)-dependent dehydrogenase (short-subunit alcohol dehydrogenase family)